MSARVYVCASSRETPRARAAMDALRAAGVAITLDWTETWQPTVEMLDSARRSAALADLRAIDDADVVLVLDSEHRSDLLAELGYALANKRLARIHVATPRGIMSSIAVEHASDDAAIAAVIAWAGGAG